MRGSVLMLALAAAGACGDRASISAAVPPRASAGPWISGYYVGYQRDLYPDSLIDFSILTHIFVGAIEPTPTGGVKTDFFIDESNGPVMAMNISTRAHQIGRKAVLMLGGEGFRDPLVAATSEEHLATFVTNLLNTMDALGYDGIDVDWEPLGESDRAPMLELLTRLRLARPTIFLSVPVGWVNGNYQRVDRWWRQVANVVDQVNIMSYGMADKWDQWVSWHQGALFGEGGDHPSSVSSSVKAYTAVGIPADKIGIGIGFYGACWRGPHGMLQPLEGATGVVASDNAMSYANIMSHYYVSSAYHWDEAASAGYLAFSTPTGPEQCTLISYDDTRSISEKGAYVKREGLGGAIIWTIGQGHLAAAPEGQRDPLLSAAYNSIVR